MPKPYNIIKWEDYPLGQKPDSLIADELGVSVTTVRTHRNKLGIPPFIGIILTQEGIPCRSIYEGMYDAYLHWKNISHEHEVKVEGLPYRADFKIGDEYIEIAGMIPYKKYVEKYETKKAAYEKFNIPVKWLFKEDVKVLYKNCPIRIKLRTERICTKCGKEEYDLVYGVCRRCGMSVWRGKAQQEAVCVLCGSDFKKDKNSKQRFCSHKCYSKSLELNWPSWEWLKEEMTRKSVRQIAFSLKIKPSSLYMHLRRARERGTIEF